MHYPHDPLSAARTSAGAPDFSGPTFQQVRRVILIAPEDSPVAAPEPDTPGTPDYHGELLAIADQLEESAAEQANKLRELCDKMYSQKEAPSDVGEAKELK